MLIVKTPEDVSQALEFIKNSEILAYDTETTGLNWRKEQVIGFGISNTLDGFYVPIHIYNTKNGLQRTDLSTQNTTAILNALKCKKLLTFNASFDLRFTKFDLGIDLLEALYCDVMLLKHTCDENYPFGLKELATKLYGSDATVEKEAMQESIKQNGGSAKEYYKADMELIAQYCVKDCLLTYRLFDHYSKDLKRQGLEAFYYEQEVLPMYKHVTIPMEEGGVCIDLKKLKTAQLEINQDLLQINQKIQKQISSYLTEFKTWILNKDMPLKTYGGKDSHWLRKHKTQEEAWLAKNPGQHMFNLQSKVHLKKLFFDKLKEKPKNLTPTGLPQVDEEFLQDMSKKYEWAGLLIDANKLVKLKGTYLDRFMEEADNGKFYPSFQQHRTVSGRLGSDFQQLPRPLEAGQASEVVIKHTNVIRELIIPDPNCKLMSADYEQLEPSIFAHTSGDPALQEIFNNGVDFYSEVAIRTEGLQNVSSDKKAENFLGKLNKPARQKAKAYALGIAYGMTGYKLQFEIETDQNTAEQLVQAYLNAFPKLATWMHKSQDLVCHKGLVQSEAGRIRHMPEAKYLFNEFGIKLRDSLQLWKDYNKHPELYKKVKEKRKTFINCLNNAINFQVQSFAASVVNRAAIAIAKELKNKGLNSRFIAQIHDELVLNVPENEIDIVGPLVQNIMQVATKISVPLRTVPQFGTNFKECK